MLPTPQHSVHRHISGRQALPPETALGDLLVKLGLNENGELSEAAKTHGLPTFGDEHPLHYVALIVRLMRSPPSRPGEVTLTRFSALIYGLLDMDAAEAQVLLLLADPAATHTLRTPQQFHMALVDLIRSRRLHRLFTCGESGEHHRGIVPGGYSERTGETFPHEMAEWRAEFRAMAPERQMLTATIVWLYQSGPDSTWLRRVPCTWSAAEALQYMSDAGCLGDWLRLLALYPGW